MSFLIVFSTSSKIVTFLPSTTSFTLFPSLSLRATFAFTVTVSKLSFSFTANAIKCYTYLRTSFALASVVTIFPFTIIAVVRLLNIAFLWLEVLPSFLYPAILYFLHLWNTQPCFFGLTDSMLLLHKFICYSSLGFNCKPNSFNFASTSSKDLRPRLRTFIISSEVLLHNSSTVLIPALFKQL